VALVLLIRIALHLENVVLLLLYLANVFNALQMPIVLQQEQPQYVSWEFARVVHLMRIANNQISKNVLLLLVILY